jgi:hypothetical protein
MRLFQNSSIMPAYRSRLSALTAGMSRFLDQRSAFLFDRFCASHFLKPVLESDPCAFFTNGNDERLQRAWARENGMAHQTTLADILLAQIEANRTEVFYNLDPVRYASGFVKRLPGCVKKSVAWRAAPSGFADFSAYDLMVCNFPTILEGYRKAGIHAAYFAPAHDPVMDEYAANVSREIDVLFIGSYTRHHRNRAIMLDAVAAMKGGVRVMFHLDNSSRFLQLAESPFGLVGPLRKHRRPDAIRAMARAPVFGRDLYKAISQAKVVLNGAIDMAGPDRGNMRCWETTGCGALLLSDEGVYPDGFSAGKTMVTYASPEDVVSTLKRVLSDVDETRRIAASGHSMIRDVYSKERQWADFLALL